MKTDSVDLTARSDEASTALPPFPPAPDTREDGQFALIDLMNYAERYAELAVLAERERVARFIESDYERQWKRPWREDLAAAIRKA